MFRGSAMKVFVDHYFVLGLPSGKAGRMLGKREIIKAYRSKALKLHPDKRPKSEAGVASRQFRKLKDSFDVLSDAGKREAFDATISSGERAEGCKRRRREAEEGWRQRRRREEEDEWRQREELQEWWKKREEERRQREEQEWKKRQELSGKREEEIEAEQKRRREEEEEWRQKEEQEWKKREDERRKREEEEAAETQRRKTEADMFLQVMVKTRCFDGVDDIPEAWKSFLHKEKDAFMC